MIGLYLLSDEKSRFKTRRCERGNKCARNGRIDLAATDPQTMLTFTVDDVVAGTVVRGRRMTAAVGDE